MRFLRHAKHCTGRITEHGGDESGVYWKGIKRRKIYGTSYVIKSLVAGSYITLLFVVDTVYDKKQ